MLGVGCRRDTPGERIIQAIQETLASLNLNEKGIKSLATIGLKADEPGIIEAGTFFNAKKLLSPMKWCKWFKAVLKHRSLFLKQLVYTLFPNLAVLSLPVLGNACWKNRNWVALPCRCGWTKIKNMNNCCFAVCFVQTDNDAHGSIVIK